MTASAMVGDVERCLEAGMNDHVAKPIDVNQLFQTLVKWIKPRDKQSPVDTSNEEDTYMDLPDLLPGIEVATALARINGNQNLYRRLISMFHEDHGHTMEHIREAVEQGALDTAHALVHGLKGVAGGIGANSLMAAAEELESRLLQKSMADLSDHLEHLNGRLKEVLEVTKPLSRHEDTENEIPTKPDF
jgi:HPt (histidine-containing phosphotransfer) domain-containing protein